MNPYPSRCPMQASAIDRRAACALLLAASGLPTRAAGVRRVAWVSIDSPNPSNESLRVWREAMRELGWIEGQNLVVDTWWAEGSADKLKSLVSYFSLELMPKRIQLMKEMLPRMKRLAVVGWPPHAGELLELDAARQAAQAQGLTLEYWGAHSGADVDAALGAIDTWKSDAVLVFAGVVASSHADRFAAWSLRRRVPTVSAWAAFADAGNLMTYGPVIGEAQARLAVFVDRILKGGKASEIPVELPARIELVLNLKTARAIGIAVPPALLQRADRVIA